MNISARSCYITPIRSYNLPNHKLRLYIKLGLGPQTIDSSPPDQLCADRSLHIGNVIKEESLIVVFHAVVVIARLSITCLLI